MSAVDLPASDVDVAIVGGGVIGAAVHYELCRRGVRSLLIDRVAFGTESTAKSAGIVRMHYSTPDVIAMAVASRDALRRLSSEADEPFYHGVGWFFLAPPELAAAAREGAQEVRAAGADVRELSAADARDVVPGLECDGVGVVLHEPESGYADTLGTTRALVSAARRLGGLDVDNVQVEKLVRSNGAVVGVDTNAGRVRASTVVLAAGPWSGGLAASAGVDLPLKVTREQDLLVCCDAETAPSVAISNAVDSIYLRPLHENGARVGSIIGRGFPKRYEEVDPQSFDHGLDADFEADLRERARLRFGALGSAAKYEGRSALYDVTPDWQPILGPVDGVTGLALATGGSGHCFKLAPAIGELVAAGITGADAPAYARLESFSGNRFEQGREYGSRYGGNRA